MQKIFIGIILLLAAPYLLHAQNSISNSKDGVVVGMAVGLGIPDGANLGVSMRFIPELTVRAGIGFIPTTRAYKHQFQIDNVQEIKAYRDALGYVPAVDGTFKISNTRGHLLLDYHPFKNKFRITTGIYIGAIKIGVEGQLIDFNAKKSIMENNTTLNPNDMPKISIYDSNSPDDKLVVQPSGDASVTASVLLGRTIQPYLGIGTGYYVPHSRVSFIWDLGVLFAGKAKASSPNVLSGDLNKMADYSKEAQMILYYSQIIPVLNIGMSIRLF